jgi:DNA-directed RNA polymerase specialized sigma24 family protein
LLSASGYSGVEIAAAIGRTDCATRTLMSRARVKVRDRVTAAA